MTALTVLGSTGSIGVSTLDVVRRLASQYRIFSLVAGNNSPRMAEQVREFGPQLVVLETESARANLIQKLEESGFERSRWPQMEFGAEARVMAATAAEAGFVMSAIVGVSGLEATYAAVLAGKKIGLANKEVLVASGQLVMEAARERNVEMIPVDSEHNGAHQALRAGRRTEVKRLILTASGGPFRKTPREDLAGVTPAQALNHPTWKMGPRITIDSATMMNKGFEVIEACWLFDFAPSDVDVVIHPQSSVHAMVEYKDGSVLAQISTTDMRMPIQYALTWPDRLEALVPRMDWTEARTMEFYPPDLDKFPLLAQAYQAQRTGGSATCTLNAADEIAVEAFLEERISYPEIYAVVAETLARVPAQEASSIGEVLEIDRRSRAAASDVVRSRSRTVTAAQPAGSPQRAVTALDTLEQLPASSPGQAPFCGPLV
ncbi:MAG: 1-deoxy-D-xylulose-5-phosphate reductoisomerase [Acidobacteriia bacterium]|nr:1-deoxy-D-xylulose-5-phosphate reductoisomerase [Terriglobia bacterium]